MPRKRGVPAQAAPIVYDAGALVAADRGERSLWAAFAVAAAERRPVVVPTPVLAQAWRGWPSQARLAKLLGGCRTVAPDETIAKQAGVVLGRSKTSDAVDAIVVAPAAALRAAVVTSDADDIAKLAEAVESEFETPILPA